VAILTSMAAAVFGRRTSEWPGWCVLGMKKMGIGVSRAAEDAEATWEFSGCGAAQRSSDGGGWVEDGQCRVQLCRCAGLGAARQASIGHGAHCAHAATRVALSSLVRCTAAMERVWASRVWELCASSPLPTP